MPRLSTANNTGPTQQRLGAIAAIAAPPTVILLFSFILPSRALGGGVLDAGRMRNLDDHRTRSGLAVSLQFAFARVEMTREFSPKIPHRFDPVV